MSHASIKIEERTFAVRDVVVYDVLDQIRSKALSGVA